MLRRLVLILAAIQVGVLGFAGTAVAYPGNSGVYGESFVDGGGVLTDDWGDNFGELGNSLCNGCANSNNTDLVVMWQAILASEGFLSGSDIDGKFGPKTEAATKSWQTRRIGASAADGKVGNQTWSAADDRLAGEPSGGTGTHYLRYTGYGGYGAVIFARGDENIDEDGGAYQMTSAWTPSGSNAKYFGGIRIQYRSLTVL